MLMLSKQNIRISVPSFNTVTGHKKPSTALSANTGEVKTSSSQDMTSDHLWCNRVFCAKRLHFEHSGTASLWNLTLLDTLASSPPHTLLFTHLAISSTQWSAKLNSSRSLKKKSPGPNTAETLWGLLLIRLSPENPGGTSCNWAPCSLHQWLFSTRPAPGATWGALTSAGGPDPHTQPALV